MFKLKVFINGFKILQQPEDIKRGCGDIFISSTGYRIASACSPAAGDNVLFLRGACKDYDNDMLFGPSFYRSMRALEEYCQFVSERLVIEF